MGMANVKVKWAGGRTFIGVDSTNHTVLMSSSKENVGMRASDLLLVSLATCSSFDVVGILVKQKIKLTKMEVEVSCENEPDPPWTFTHFHLKYFLAGEGLQPEQAENAIRLSEEKYCSVAATVKGKAMITWEFVIE
jgi:putative redox protein